jgi:arsenate reductase-like glutaredoxin family protein
METEERDFFQDKFTEDEFQELLGGRRAADVFSWHSPSFKALGRPAESLSEEELVQLMLQEPRLIRRPLVVVNGQLVIGSSQKALEAALA